MRGFAAALALALLAATLTPAVAAPSKPQTVVKVHKPAHPVLPTHKPATKAHKGG